MIQLGPLEVRIVADWRNGWKWLSNIFAGLGITMVTAWEFMPPDLKSGFSPTEIAWIVKITFALVLLGRMVDQKRRPPDEPPPGEPPCLH